MVVFGIGSADPTPDFQSEILPIFQQHCLNCHGSEERQGELDLETLAGVRLGGHSGNPLLAKQLDQSELYLRVTSTTPGYRMPKQGDSLSKNKLKTLAAWIQTTSPTASVVPIENAAQTISVANSIKNSNATDADNASMLPWLDALSPSQLYQAVGITTAIALLLLYLMVRAVQTRNKKRRENPDHRLGSASTLLGWTVKLFVATSLCVALAGFAYYYFLAARLSQQVDELTADAAKLKPQTTSVTQPIGPQHLPLPPSPMHPPRLGGRYYRGNDERDPALFNGGFYRTATIDLRLVDADDNPLEWGDTISGDLFVEITIDRAPQATRELFTDRVRKGVTLQHFNLPNQIDGQQSQLTVVEAEQRWRARIALPTTGSWQEERTTGMIYLMYGTDYTIKTASGSPSPRPHFGIQYKVDLNESKISQLSTLWMGSMYTLAGRVIVPRENQVLLDRWFDWRPIPVIKGKGSNDPKLLGLPEHLQKAD